MSTYLIHHGIKGQKWGVRRFQNEDGTLTEAGKKHALEQRRIQATSKTNDKVTDIVKSMTPDDLYNLGYSKEEIARGDPAVQLAGPDAGKSVAKRFIVEYGDKPVSFLDLEEFVVDGEKILNAVIGTRSGEEYRGKGFASQVVKEGTEWFDRNAERYGYTEINWGARSTNEASKKLAEKSGFERRESYEEGWDDYAYRKKKSPKDLTAKSFGGAVSSVTSKLSNHPHPIAKQPLDVDEVMSRGNVSKKEAVECSRLADKVYARASKNEPEITKDIVGSVSESGAKMYGLQYRLKQPTSIAGKIASDSKEDGVSFVESSRGIKDSVRYTAVSNNKDFVKNYKSIKSNLESKGYEETRCKNFFVKYQNGEVQHKAVQCTYKSPKGFIFELQFQTPESQAAKDLKVPLYEERRRRGVSEERASELEAQMRNLAERVPYPNDISEIKSH